VSPPRSPRSPFGAGAVSLRLYTHDDLPADAAVADLGDQARAAEHLGFDGVTMGEHHAGFAGYTPSPVVVAASLLAATDALWVAPCPVLLPLRRAATVTEDIAWLAAAFPGRVGCGFAAGSLAADFDLVGVPLHQRGRRFAAAIGDVVGALAGRPDGATAIASDPAVARCRQHPVPTLLAGTSQAGVARAAALGAGVHLDLVSRDSRLRELADHYLAGGGTGPRVLIRQVWLGSGAPPRALHASQRDVYGAFTAPTAKRHWLPDDHTVVAATADELVARLLGTAAAASASALDLRVTVAGMTPDETRDQVERLGHEVLPLVRAAGVLEAGWAA
jgi:alkanesulfonate monooxygenase SsuD/methylene tetrahydromethanopterin reductase-like flavin-dependent oxidoreductase (luciferase family)